MKEFSSLLGQSSFYGGNEETVCSLLLKILPRPGHKYKLVTQSLVSVDSEVNDTSSSFTTEGFSNKKALLLKNVVKSLHEFGGFCYMEVRDNWSSYVHCLYCTYRAQWKN